LSLFVRHDSTQDDLSPIIFANNSGGIGCPFALKWRAVSCNKFKRVIFTVAQAMIPTIGMRRAIIGISNGEISVSKFILPLIYLYENVFKFDNAVDDCW
jgi:hypothetical protein